MSTQGIQVIGITAVLERSLDRIHPQRRRFIRDSLVDTRDIHELRQISGERIEIEQIFASLVLTLVRIPLGARGASGTKEEKSEDEEKGERRTGEVPCAEIHE